MGKKIVTEPVNERSTKVKTTKVKPAVSKGTNGNGVQKENVTEELVASISGNGHKSNGNAVPPTPLDSKISLRKSLQDFFGFDKTLKLQYRGRLDASKITPVPNARRDLFEAMLQIARTGAGPKDQIPSMGCSIKWKHH